MATDAPAVLESSLVESFVANAHGDLDAVRAAAHMGRRDLAELLLAHGARLDVFAAAMLGHVEVVRAILAAHPKARDAAGPHGIPLLAHAEVGGGRARAVVELLER